MSQHSLSRGSSSSATDVVSGDEKAVADRSDADSKRLESGDASDKEAQKPDSTPVVEPPPDGGLIAWLQVLSSWLLFFNTWGLINAFGVFQTYYDMTLNRSASDVAWIGTFQAFMLLLVGSVAGPLYDKGHLRFLLIFGTLCTSFGMMMVSLSTEYYQIFLAQGVVIGIGSGCLQIPSLAIPAQYFAKKRAMAIGIAATGGSIGALVYPVVFRKLQAEVSFGWATRAIGFLQLGTLAVVCVLCKARVPPSKVARALLDVSAFKNPAFIVCTLGILLYLMAIYMPFFYVETWAQSDLGLGADLSFYLFLIMNAGSVFGRAIPGVLADRLGSLNVLIVTIILSGIMIFAWISVKETWEAIVFCIFYGFFSGAGVSLAGTTIAGITPELNKVGTWLGMSLSIAGLGLLIGTPVAGVIVDSSPDKSFVGTQCFGGAVVLAGAVSLGVLRYMKYRKGVTWTMKA